MNGAYGGGGPWGGPSVMGGAKMAAIHQCLDALRPPVPASPRPSLAAVAMPPTTAALDALPSPSELFCAPAPIVAPQTAPDATAAPTSVPEALPNVAHGATCTTAPTATIAKPARPVGKTSDASSSARAVAALRSPAVLAIGAAIVVVLVLVVIAPPFVLRKRGGSGASGDPAWRWVRPRSQVDPVRLLAWGLLTAAAAFVLPLAVERLISPAPDESPKSTLFCRKTSAKTPRSS